MKLFGCDQRKALVQVEAHLMTEHRARARAGTVSLVMAMLEYMAHEVYVLLHAKKVCRSGFYDIDGVRDLRRAAQHGRSRAVFFV